MAKIIMRVEGLDGQIELMTDRVVIHREGLWNAMKYGFNAKREIPLGAISEVAFKEAGTLSLGQIEFVRSGRSTDEKIKGNANMVKFKKSSNEAFDQMKEKIFEMMNHASRQQQ